MVRVHPLSGPGAGVLAVPLVHWPRHNACLAYERGPHPDNGTCFEWGYGGSGPSDLARSILADALPRDCPECGGSGLSVLDSPEEGPSSSECWSCLGDGTRAWALHHAFKWAFVAGWGESWRITPGEVREWAERERGGDGELPLPPDGAWEDPGPLGPEVDEADPPGPAT
jgi:hypothetical protein